MFPLPKTDKSLGQHYLTDQNIINKICQDYKNLAEAILEIGPGPGILCQHLNLLGLPYEVIEKDHRFKDYLLSLLSPGQITIGDALEIKLQDFLKTKSLSDKKIWLVSNLPYNVATPLLILFLQTPEIKYMTLMFQKEVADKIFPFATTKNFMCSLLVITQTFFECQLLTEVPPSAFTPAPKVDSAVLSLKRRDTPLIPLNEFKILEKFLRQLFSNRRKQLGGVLKSYYDKNKIQLAFETLGLSPTIRAEALSQEEVLKLYRIFHP